MITKKLLNMICGAFFALLCISELAAQPPPTSTANESVNAVIASNSGRERRLNGQNGYIGRAGLRPRQLVRVSLGFPVGLAGGSVAVLSPDGGAILPPLEALRIMPDGTVSFLFEPGAHHGLYRVFVEVVGQRHLLEFYVMDLENPGNNPPRLRIVD
jgi:hypothetical protein